MNNQEFDFYDLSGCFGHFNPRDSICIRFCALRLRCAIEMEKINRAEIFDDMLIYENLNMKIQ